MPFHPTIEKWVFPGEFHKLDPSVISVSKLKDILSGNPVLLHKTSGEGVIVRIVGKRVIVGNGRGLE